MKKAVGPGTAFLLAGAVVLALPWQGVCRGQEVPRPGQLKRVLFGLKKDGRALFDRELGRAVGQEFVAHLMYLSGDARGNLGGSGLYRPSASRHGWDWLRQRLGKGTDEAISFKEFAGPREWFETLDKDKDGLLTREDFAWFGDSALARASAKAKPLFEKIDLDGNGQVTLDEWKAWFDALSGGRGYVGQDDLLPLFMGAKRAGSKGGQKRSMLPLICAYIAGDVGTFSAGPALGELAPDFTLMTADGKGRLTLSQHRGKKPLVLIFGSFT
jgi:hypothetical protein